MKDILNQLDESMNLHLLNYKATSLLKEFIMNISDNNDTFLVYQHSSMVVNNQDKSAHGYIILIADKTISDTKLSEIFGKNKYTRQINNITVYLDYTEAELLSHNNFIEDISSSFYYALNCLDGLDAYSDAAYEIENTLKRYEK